MRTTYAPLALLATFALAGCRGDTVGAPTARHVKLLADEAPRFSDWSTPVNLGPVVNSPFIEQGA
jgi:hypothetical protein